MRPMVPCLVLIAALPLCGCKRPDPTAPKVTTLPISTAQAAEVTSSAVDPRIEACRIRMTAPESRQWITWWDPKGVALAGEGPSSVHSVYWASAKEKQTLRANKTAMPLDINCRNDGPPALALSLAAFASSEKDLPLGPGRYAIVGKMSGEVQPGQFLAGTLTVGTAMYDARGGTLVLEKFDMEGVKGTFSLDGVDAVGAAKPIHLEGSFEIPCHGGMLETECKANKVKAEVAAP
jgi:hypothetical protein